LTKLKFTAEDFQYCKPMCILQCKLILRRSSRTFDFTITKSYKSQQNSRNYNYFSFHFKVQAAKQRSHSSIRIFGTVL